MRTLNRTALRIVIAGTLTVLSTLNQTNAATRDFLWKISGKQNTIYLVGSVHMLTKDYYPLSPALDTAFKDSNLLVEEADLAELQGSDGQLLLVARGVLPDAQSLDKV